jgi:hypothetical protein
VTGPDRAGDTAPVSPAGDAAPAGRADGAARWWGATRRGVLLLQHCGDCGHVQHPPRPLCTGCGGDRLADRPAAGAGTVDSFTVVHRAADPAVPVPYTLARVRLAEGPVLLTHLVGGGEPRCDAPARLAWRDLPDGRRLPVFTLEEQWTSS